MPPDHKTVTEVLESLKKQGFTIDFNLAFDCIKCEETQKCLAPYQFEITKHYRFEGESDPGDSMVIYAIEEKDGPLKGTLVTGYGMYADKLSEKMIEKLAYNRE